MNKLLKLTPAIGLALLILWVNLLFKLSGIALYQISEQIYLFDTFADRGGYLTSSMGLCTSKQIPLGIELILHNSNNPAIYFSRQFPQIADCDLSENNIVALKWRIPCSLEAGEYTGTIRIVTKEGDTVFFEEYNAAQSITVSKDINSICLTKDR